MQGKIRGPGRSIRIMVQRARFRRITGWVVKCTSCGVIGDPTIQKWTKAKARNMAILHANDRHPAGSYELLEDTKR